jgi:hypothetical protein
MRACLAAQNFTKRIRTSKDLFQSRSGQAQRALA